MFTQPPFHTITADPWRKLIHARIVGSWSGEMVDRYMLELGKMIEEQSRMLDAFGVLIDGRAFAVQPPAVSIRFMEAAVHWPPPGTGPVKGMAVVVGSILNKLQAQRTSGPRVRVFREMEVATAWLEERIAAASTPTEDVPQNRSQMDLVRVRAS